MFLSKSIYQVRYSQPLFLKGNQKYRKSNIPTFMQWYQHTTELQNVSRGNNLADCATFDCLDLVDSVLLPKKYQRKMETVGKSSNLTRGGSLLTKLTRCKMVRT